MSRAAADKPLAAKLAIGQSAADVRRDLRVDLLLYIPWRGTDVSLTACEDSQGVQTERPKQNSSNRCDRKSRGGTRAAASHCRATLLP